MCIVTLLTTGFAILWVIYISTHIGIICVPTHIVAIYVDQWVVNRNLKCEAIPTRLFQIKISQQPHTLEIKVRAVLDSTDQGLFKNVFTFIPRVWRCSVILILKKCDYFAVLRIAAVCYSLVCGQWSHSTWSCRIKQRWLMKSLLYYTTLHYTILQLI